MKNEPVSDDLLVKYLLGESSAQEQTAVRDWAAASEDNARTLEDFNTLWQKSRMLKGAHKPDTEAAWQRFQQRISVAEQTPQPAPRTIAFGWKNVMRIAAVLVLLAGAGIGAWQYSRAPQILALEAGDKPLTGTLPDGSVVTLNRHSTLHYPEDFNGDTREVSLNGEGFFNITANKARPFIIDANGVDVTVVGTSFNVRSVDSSTEVIVETGVVEVRSAASSVRLQPNEEAVVLKGAIPVKQRKEDDFYRAYRTGFIQFDNTSLQRVAEVLGEVYGVNVRIENGAVGALKSRNARIAIGVDSIEEALSNALPEGVRQERKDNQILITWQ